MIISSAVKLVNGSVYMGERHGDCYQWIKTYIGDKEICLNSIQGFINDSLHFLTRQEAYYEALENGQCKLQEYPFDLQQKHLQANNGLYISESEWKPCLFSEDLW